jgi:hypothetical protein
MRRGLRRSMLSGRAVLRGQEEELMIDGWMMRTLRTIPLHGCLLGLGIGYGREGKNDIML